MRILMAMITLGAVVAWSAAPALAQERDAARAACMTYAQVQTDEAPAASPRLDTAPPARGPAERGIQAPAAGPTDRGIQAPGTSTSAPSAHDLADKSPAFQQAFNDCMRKLAS